MSAKAGRIRSGVNGVPLKPKSKIWYWYSARENEIFCDLDSPRALGRAIGVLRRILSDPKRWPQIASIWLYRSNRAGHYHLVVVLAALMDSWKRAQWAMWLGSDMIRGLYIMRRLDYGGAAYRSADLISTRHRWDHRSADGQCSCVVAKHKKKKDTDRCPAMVWMLGSARSAEFFPVNRDRKKHGGGDRLPWGRVPVLRIKQS